MLQAVFIDRDGTIGGTDHVVYPGEFQLYPHVEKSIQKLKEKGFLIISFTNQPGISKGEVQIEEYENELKEFGFDQVYLCPHQHDDGCSCRKPSPGMLIQAANENNLNLTKCFVIGDRWTDMMAANEVGCIKVLVKTGAGEEAFNKYIDNEYYGKWAGISPDYVADNLLKAVEWILSR
ncbi:HAD-IIIA family hydrolase [Ornithinibacillus halophilus]|uniref:D,D-heptose 1,7-bisphosphate phosphatase n=1 Tax=Ornithinibacillus halophilus TaxID=930117 RepID=A0A1M5LFA1_9BACI|nr:HAD-IIIA family hydrolase [Ornithinibacillus halophilus]SHG63812.1 haloacid dehalogenase superfamily, subfamily IA, variant 1 with third motif having Dx(3-4)D or Dx(3-4)E [Ornithinibacillus halophilus]